MSAPRVGSRAGKRREPMPAPHQMPTVVEAQNALADVEERVIRGESVDASEWASAEAAVRLAEKEGEIAERVLRRQRQEALAASAAEGDRWFDTEGAPLAANVVQAMAGAVEAARVLAAALAEYQRGADVAVAKISRVRQAPTHWPAGRHLADKVFDEVKAAGMGRPPSRLSTPISQQFAAVVGAARVGSDLLPGSGGADTEER